jgi:hypothetical protein
MSRDWLQGLRRRVQLAGGHTATILPESSTARTEAPRIRVAEVVEPPLRAIPCGAPTAWDAPVAFLDGVQQTALVGYLGTDPLLAARIAAGVRLRVDRTPRAAVHRRRSLLLGRPETLATLGDLPPDVEAVPLPVEGPAHPIAMLDAARLAVDAARGQLELDVAAVFRREHPQAWLLVDGSLTVSPDWATDARMVGLVKSHTTLPFEGADLEVYLTLPPGHRSSAYRPPTRTLTPVYAVGLRLRAWAGQDLLHGLVRVERPATEASLGGLDVLAGRLFAERAPLAADGRADRLLYGVHDVERWLRASR